MELRESRIKKDRIQGVRNPARVEPKEAAAGEGGNHENRTPGGQCRFGDGDGGLR